MPLWTTAILAGGSVVAGVRVLQGSRRKRLAERLAGQTALLEDDSTGLVPVSIGRLLLSDATSLSPRNQKRRIDLHLAIAIGSVGLTSIGLVFSSFTVVGTVFITIATIEIYRDALHALVNERRLRHSIIDALAITTALIANLYLASAVAATLYFAGMRFLVQAEGETNRTLSTLFESQERYAWRIQEDDLMKTLITDLVAGDYIMVRAGEVVPIDGIVVEGIASIDQRALTGESQPVTKTVDSEVFAATIVEQGEIKVLVRESGEDTIAMEIATTLKLYQQQQKQMIQRAEIIADQASAPTLGLSALAWMALGPFSAAAVLNSNFSELLRITMPLSLINHVQLATQQGILFKNSTALELFKSVDTVVFDKTGTLTLEQPILKSIVSVSDYDEDTLLWFAALAEQQQAHPIAKAIQAETEHLKLPQLEHNSYEVGYGIHIEWDGHVVYVGSLRYMDMIGIDVTNVTDELADRMHQGFTCIMIAIDGQLGGWLEFAAQLRPHAKDVVQYLMAHDIDVHIVSGDHELPTHYIARQLGITNYHFEVLPENKANFITYLKHENRTVCFIGDGINDALALQRADVSISLGSATAIATDIAKVIILEDDLSQISYLFDLAQSYHRNMRRTISATYVPGIVCIGGIFLFSTTIIGALALYYTSFLITVGNTMLPFMRKHLQQGEQVTLISAGYLDD